MSLGDHVRDRVGIAVLIGFQFSSGFSNWQIDGEAHTKFVDCPL